MLKVSADPAALTYPLYLEFLQSLKAFEAKECSAHKKGHDNDQKAPSCLENGVGSMLKISDLLLSFKDRVRLCKTGSDDKDKMSLELDFLSGSTAYRLFHNNDREAVVRAVFGRHKILNDGPLKVFDVTAGLGRDSIILAKAQAEVTMFERHPVVYALLHDALIRAEQALSGEHFSFALPKLADFGEYLSQADCHVRPDVIYYDPMFPTRKKSAGVKKGMQFFHDLIGSDEDLLPNLLLFLEKARKKVVVKRPKKAPHLCVAGLKAAYTVGSGVCRFEIFQV